MTVHVSGRRSPARFALDTVLDVAGLSTAESNDALSLNIAMPDSDTNARETRLYFGAVSDEVALRFGVRQLGELACSTLRFACGEPLWTADDLDIIDRFASRDVAAPLAQRLAVSVSRDRTSEVLLRDANGDALVLRQGDAIWSLWNIPESLALLLGEGYLMSTANETRDWLATWRPAQQLYYRLPSAWRSRVQKRMIRGLDDKLAQQPADQFATRYPIDAIGWLLLRAIRNLIRLTGGDALPSVDPWPNGSRACVVVSQDIEPTRYAYRHGLPRLLNWLQAEGTPPHTINVVGNEARREPKLWNRSKFTHNEVGCHGWLHDGREARLPRASMIEYFDRARNVIESLHGVPVTTFRSPRLDRSPSLYEALEICGFTCDSTIPDVDRENTHRWGGGCSFNFPFHPVVAAGPDWRQLDLLECPVTAPDCAMPVFAGGTEAEAIALYSRKLDWIEAIGGCAVAIFHGGVFDDEDAGLRQRLLAGYYRSLAGRNVWRATLRELEKWWRIRQSLHASVSDGAVTLANRGSSHSFPVRLSWRGTSWMVPALAPGTSWSSATLESCAVEARVH